jgi:hypothetical protein
MPTHFDIAIAWDWEYDHEFVSLLEHAAQARGLTTHAVSPPTLQEIVAQTRGGEYTFSVFLDRASDTDERFLPFAQAVRLTPARIVNTPEAVRHAADKATMHLEFLTHGIDVPYTLIISPYSERQDVGISLNDLARLGRPFIIKPANTTGGGTGVILGAETLRDVIESRQHHKNDKYLLQEKIEPAHVGGETAWFRVFWAFGTITPCWWHPDSHVYKVAEGDAIDGHSLAPLRVITQSIHDVCQLDFFSTEIALTERGRFVTVDYVNEVCDMRLQSLHPDGVPDQVVMKICDCFADFVKSYKAQALSAVDSHYA